MSRTLKGKKGPGYEYWSRKANSAGKNFSSLYHDNKKLLHKTERRTNKIKVDQNVAPI